MAEQYRHICPYNCYSACGIISRVTAGRVTGLSGDLQHGYNRGHLCAKGHSFLSAASHPDRLRSPMLQQPRGSGRFKEIDWPEALSILTTQMVSLYNQYGSYEPVCLYTQSGNMGTLHQAWSWLAHDLGCTIATARCAGVPDWTRLAMMWAATPSPGPKACAKASTSSAGEPIRPGQLSIKWNIFIKLGTWEPN